MCTQAPAPGHIMCTQAPAPGYINVCPGAGAWVHILAPFALSVTRLNRSEWCVNFRFGTFLVSNHLYVPFGPIFNVLQF